MLLIKLCGGSIIISKGFGNIKKTMPGLPIKVGVLNTLEKENNNINKFM